MIIKPFYGLSNAEMLQGSGEFLRRKHHFCDFAICRTIPLSQQVSGQAYTKELS